MYQDKLTAFRKTIATLQRMRIFRDSLATGDEGPEMVWLPGGTFSMGQTGHETDEYPPHEVAVEPFSICRYPVTFREYDYFVESLALGMLKTTDWWPSELPSPQDGRRRLMDLPVDNGWGRGDRPVIQVTWYDALAYAEWLTEQSGHTYRLPTEAEWEYAVRAGTTSIYSFGDDAIALGDYAWYTGNAGNRTQPVGQKAPNPWGLYDMHGNAWEWTCSRYAPKYSGWEQQCVTTAYTKDIPISVRGGAWLNQAAWLRSGLRYWYQPGYKSSYLGFRLVRE